jgi:sec-independent protein translocase protein TatA
MHTMLALGGLGGGEIFVIVLVVMVLFGARKIPEFAKGLGQAVKEFKKASNEETPASPPASAPAPNPPTTK